MKVLRFNQDATCCVITHHKRVSIYNCDPFGECFSINWEENNSKYVYDNDHQNNISFNCKKGNSDTQTNVGINNKRNDKCDNINEVFGEDSQSTPSYREVMVNEYDDCIVEMLFSTSLMTMTNGNKTNRRKLKIINTKRKSTICELIFPTDIIDVVMNRKRLCVLLSSDQIFIYDISCMKLLDTIDLWENKINSPFPKNNNNNNNTTENDNDVNKLLQNQLNPKHAVGHLGSSSKIKSTSRAKSIIGPKIALSNDDRSILAFSTYHPTKSDPNNHVLRDVIIYDAINIKPINYLNDVHKGNIACLAINQDGTLITTASEQGTIIRVYNTGINAINSSNKSNSSVTLNYLQFNSKTPLLFEFRRGNRPSNIYQLTFNLTSTLIGCVGDSGTIHIFKLNDLFTYNETTGRKIPNIDHVSSLINSNKNNQDSDINETLDTEYSNKSNLDRSKQEAHFLSKRIKATIPKQNLQRDFAHVNTHDTNNKYCLGFPEEFPNQIYLAGDDGQFFTYAIPQTSLSLIHI